MGQIRVVPTSSDRLVADPTTRKQIPAEGITVSDSTFWRRRETDGDVTITVVPDEGSTARTLPTRRRRTQTFGVARVTGSSAPRAPSSTQKASPPAPAPAAPSVPSSSPSPAPKQ